MGYDDGERGFWFWALIVMSATYLCCELAFNSQLLDVVGTLANVGQVEQLATEGRLISATGLILLAFSHLVRRKRQGEFFDAFAILCTLIVTAGPAMYFGEKALVNHLARSASLSVRQHASDILVMKKGLAEGAVSIKGIPYHGDRPTPADKTFLSLSGAMVFSNGPFMREVSSKRHEIVRKTASLMAGKHVAGDYGAYRRAIRRLSEDYDRYYRGYHALQNAQANARALAQRLWVKANQRVFDAYRHYQRRSHRFDEEVRRKAKVVTPKLLSFFKVLKQCQDGACQQEYARRYRHEARRYMPDPPQWTYWCNHTGGATYNCGNVNRRSVAKRLRRLLVPEFTHKAGIAPDVGYSRFVKSKLVLSRFKRRARREGIDLPANWTLGQEAVFLKRAAKAVWVRAKANYRQSIEKAAGGYLPPGLTRKAFYASPVVQKRARKELGWHRPGPVPLDLGERGFLHKVALPKARERGDEALRSMEEKRRALGHDQRYASAGRSYIKDVIVPPIALSFSLFFGLLNLLNVGKEAAFGLFGWPRKGWLNRGVKALILIVVIFGPFAFRNRISNSQAYDRMLTQAHQTLGLAAWPFGWIMRAEPAAYPTGAAVRGALIGAATDAGVRSQLSTMLEKLGR